MLFYRSTNADWAIDELSRGGHIPGATDFAANNLTCEYDEDRNLEGLSRDEVLTEMMENKAITPEKIQVMQMVIFQRLYM